MNGINLIILPKNKVSSPRIKKMINLDMRKFSLDNFARAMVDLVGLTKRVIKDLILSETMNNFITKIDWRTL